MTIYALSTGPGISGIAIIRVSGEDTKKVIQLLTNAELPFYNLYTEVLEKHFEEDDVPKEWEGFIELNAEMAPNCEVITEKKEPLI